jgi:pilus assembly protein Flp/PilA
MILTKVKSEVGTTAIEYGIIASLIGVLTVSGMSAVGVNLSNTYCTVSKYLGGSGTCSGATSSSSSSVSLANGGTLADLKTSLSDTLDDSFVDTSQGGTARISDDKEWRYPNELMYVGSMVTLSNEQKQLENLNATDPITNIFGIYDAKTGEPITDYGSVMSGINNQSILSYYDSHDNSPGIWYKDGGNMQVTTQSGKVYTIDNDSVTESAKK